VSCIAKPLDGSQSASQSPNSGTLLTGSPEIDASHRVKIVDFNAHCPKFSLRIPTNFSGSTVCELMLGFCHLFYLAINFLSGTTRASSHFASIPARSRFCAKQGAVMYKTLLLSLTLHSQSKPSAIQSGAHSPTASRIAATRRRARSTRPYLRQIKT
jgi:hypothetical protein